MHCRLAAARTAGPKIRTCRAGWAAGWQKEWNHLFSFSYFLTAHGHGGSLRHRHANQAQRTPKKSFKPIASKSLQTSVMQRPVAFAMLVAFLYFAGLMHFGATRQGPLALADSRYSPLHYFLSH
jgi:hypothetical protein